MLFAKLFEAGNCISAGFYICGSYGPSRWRGFWLILDILKVWIIYPYQTQQNDLVSFN